MKSNKSLIDKADLAKALLNFFLGLMATAIGFFLALYFNNKVEIRKELIIFDSLRKGILTEVKHNKMVIDSSFHIYVEDIVLGELSTKVSNEYLTNDLFLKYSDSELLINLQEYIRDCNLCNDKKNMLNEFRTSGERLEWTSTIQENLLGQINKTEITIQEITNQLINSK